MRYRVAWALVAASGLAGCEMAPAFMAPTVAMSAHYADDGGGGPPPRSAWWRSFDDVRLDGLEADLDAANPDLAAALAIYQVARARADEATAGLFPEVDFDGGLSYNRQSAHRPLRSANQPTYYGANQIVAQVASYELDVWGRVADLVKSAKANAVGAGDAFADVRLELHAELARDYLDLRGLDAEARLLADTIKVYRDALNLTQQRLDAKIAPPIDAQRAQAQLSVVEAQASDLALRRTALVDAVATLAGHAAAGYRVNPDSAQIAFPRRPRTVTGDVLRRRPDVAAAEESAIAANDLIGVARANMYPKFTIALLGGTQDTGLNLLNLQNTLFSLGPTMTVPLFDAGLREAEVKEAQAQAKVAGERYRATVLRAVQEVQDELSALRWLADEAGHANTAATAASKALDMSMAIYRDGAASYLDVVTAQDAALSARRAVIEVRTRQAEAYVGLIMGLGGGWLDDHGVNAATLAAANPVVDER